MQNFLSFPSGTVDLHLHTSASDGSDTPAQLLCALREKGIRIFSVTDHDSIDAAEAIRPLVPQDMRYIPGIEFSCTSLYGDCHILGYGFDLSAPPILSALELGRQRRMKNLKRRIAYLDTTFGIRLTEDEKAWLYAQSSPGKPHLGRILLNRGIAPDLDTAIRTFIAPCKTPNGRIGADIAISAIRDSGGIPVWAHPLGGEGERRLTSEAFCMQLGCLLPLGIRGLECCYSRYGEAERTYLLDMARRYRLLVSGGSDYHGTNKTAIVPGQLSADDASVPRDALTILSHLPE